MLVPDGCWHEWDKTRKAEYSDYPVCLHCEKVYIQNPDLTTWENFGLCWEAAQTMDWWEEFLKWAWVHDDQAYLGRMSIGVKFVNPVTFMKLLYEFGDASGRIED